MNKNEILLSVRLQMLVALVEACERIIDVGSDHGLVPSFIIEKGIAKRGIATDIHEAPAKRAELFFKERELSEVTEVFHTDGLGDIRVQEGDTVILAGMGGYEILHILRDAFSRGEDSISPEAVFIFQPQRNFVELRTFLYEKGFFFAKEEICLDRGKWYTAIKGRFSQKEGLVPTIEVLHLGEFFNLFQKNEAYLLYQREKLQKICRGKPDYQPVLDKIERALEDLENGV